MHGNAHPVPKTCQKRQSQDAPAKNACNCEKTHHHGAMSTLHPPRVMDRCRGPGRGVERIAPTGWCDSPHHWGKIAHPTGGGAGRRLVSMIVSPKLQPTNTMTRERPSWPGGHSASPPRSPSIAVTGPISARTNLRVMLSIVGLVSAGPATLSDHCASAKPCKAAVSARRSSLYVSHPIFNDCFIFASSNTLGFPPLMPALAENALSTLSITSF